jgi:hyperosmotically inducible periplasmic protein
MNRPDDRRLAGEVERAIGLEPRVGLTNLHVQVIDGTAFLRGVVGSLEQREAAGRAASRVAGIRKVENDLTVAADEDRSDRKLQRALEEVLAAVPGLDPAAVGARVERGVAHLVGHVQSAAQEEAALAAARRVSGLKDVVSQIAITTGAPGDPVGLTNRVAQALAQDDRINARPIAVEAGRDGAITLAGEVASAEEREIAHRIALAVPGVHHVVNELVARNAG